VNSLQSACVLHDGGRCLYIDYSDPIDAPNDWFRDESFTIVRHCPLTKCAWHEREHLLRVLIRVVAFFSRTTIKTSARIKPLSFIYSCMSTTSQRKVLVMQLEIFGLYPIIYWDNLSLNFYEYYVKKIFCLFNN